MARLRTLFILLLMFAALPAQAAVTITFYSHALGWSFPHAFFTLRGTIDATGVPVDVNYGFTAVSVTPALLQGPVRGKIENPTPSYVRSSRAHFSVVMTDAEYGRVAAVVQRWRDAPQNSYSLDTANCIHFVAEAARAIGLEATVTTELRRRPTSFLNMVQTQNRAYFAARERHTAVAAVR